jgi:hypothetical protein
LRNLPVNSNRKSLVLFVLKLSKSRKTGRWFSQKDESLVSSLLALLIESCELMDYQGPIDLIAALAVGLSLLVLLRTLVLPFVLGLFIRRR